MRRLSWAGIAELGAALASAMPVGVALGAMVLALGPEVGSVVEVAKNRGEARVRIVSSNPNLAAHPRNVPCPCLTLSASSLLTLK